MPSIDHDVQQRFEGVMMRKMNQLRVGSIVEPRELLSIHSEPIPIPDQRQLVHLQFRRFAGCPVCNLHLHSVEQRHDAILAASIREVIVFHTSAEELSYHAGNLPFAVIGDPGKKLYAEFGVESGPRALLDPRAWLPILRGVFRSLMAIFRGSPLPPLNPHGGRLGLPADFLIASDGKVLACKYGAHAYDQWSVDELLALSRPAGIARQMRSRAQSTTNAY